jgi:hypothetical protein
MTIKKQQGDACEMLIVDALTRAGVPALLTPTNHRGHDIVAHPAGRPPQRIQVVHHVEQSLFPNSIGTSQVRYMELDGDRLTLTTEPFHSGRTPMLLAAWERATTAAAVRSD